MTTVGTVNAEPINAPVADTTQSMNDSQIVLQLASASVSVELLHALHTCCRLFLQNLEDFSLNSEIEYRVLVNYSVFNSFIYAPP